MDANTLRKSVWEEMLMADMRANYFAELVRHYLRWDKALRWSSLIFTSGSLLSALSQAPAAVKVIAPVIATAISFWLLMSQYSTMARDASDLHRGWSGIAREYERLWNNLESRDTEARYNEIYERAQGLSNSGIKFPNKEDRLGYWLDQAAMLARSRYA
jgi:hypothetical protein